MRRTACKLPSCFCVRPGTSILVGFEGEKIVPSFFLKVATVQVPSVSYEEAKVMFKASSFPA